MSVHNSRAGGKPASAVFTAARVEDDDHRFSPTPSPPLAEEERRCRRLDGLADIDEVRAFWRRQRTLAAEMQAR